MRRDLAFELGDHFKGYVHQLRPFARQAHDDPAAIEIVDFARKIAHLVELEYKLADGLLRHERASSDRRDAAAAQVEVGQDGAVRDPNIGITAGTQCRHDLFVDAPTRAREQLAKIAAALGHQIVQNIVTVGQ